LALIVDLSGLAYRLSTKEGEARKIAGYDDDDSGEDDNNFGKDDDKDK
jgi:hypothetical protein